MAKLDISGTNIGFTSCHLAPHEDQKKVLLRNEMIGHILDRARVEATDAMPSRWWGCRHPARADVRERATKDD